VKIIANFFEHAYRLEMTPLGTPQPAQRLVDVVNYSNAFSKPKMSSQKVFAKAVPYEPRKRPLRTYGRAAAPDRDEEPPRKKRVFGTDSVSDESNKENTPSSPKLPELPPQPSVAAKKGSILAFFKPLSSSSKPVSTSSSTPQSGLSSDLPEETDETAVSSPPSSPPVPRVLEKKKRRLGTRAVVAPSSPVLRSRDDSQASEDQDGDEQEQKVAEAKKVGEKNAAEDGTKVEQATKRKATRATVQTTLALTDDPAFTICNDCEMLYNPLNEKDRKDHARRHAAAVRKKGKLSGEEE
jgi:hypothetical protein